jgi:hypothetical protein
MLLEREALTLLPSRAQGPREPNIAFRMSLADEADAESIRRLAALAGSPAPQGLVAIADLDGEPVAALGFADAQAVADPARSTPAIVALLHLHRWALRTVGAVWGC